MERDIQAIRDMFDEVSLGSPDNAVGFVLWRIVHKYQRVIDGALEPLDLTHLQFTTLAMAAWLTKDGDTVSQSAIAQAAEIQPMQVSHMMKTLKAKGLVSSMSDARDGRAVVISVTEEGATRLRAAMPVAIQVQREMFGETDELLSMLRCLGKAQTNRDRS